MSYTLLYPKRYDITPIQEALETSSVLAEPIQTQNELKIGDGITVFLLDAPSRPDFPNEYRVLKHRLLLFIVQYHA